jgi:ABC-type iron transport system FetAB permease component
MDDPEQGGNQRMALVGLGIAVLLLVVGVWLSHQLGAAIKMQDCLMSGRTNCNTIETPVQ